MIQWTNVFQCILIGSMKQYDTIARIVVKLLYAFKFNIQMFLTSNDRWWISRYEKCVCVQWMRQSQSEKYNWEEKKNEWMKDRKRQFDRDGMQEEKNKTPRRRSRKKKWKIQNILFVFVMTSQPLTQSHSFTSSKKFYFSNTMQYNGDTTFHSVRALSNSNRLNIDTRAIH